MTEKTCETQKEEEGIRHVRRQIPLYWLQAWQEGERHLVKHPVLLTPVDSGCFCHSSRVYSDLLYSRYYSVSILNLIFILQVFHIRILLIKHFYFNMPPSGYVHIFLITIKFCYPTSLVSHWIIAYLYNCIYTFVTFVLPIYNFRYLYNSLHRTLIYRVNIHEFINLPK